MSETIVAISTALQEGAISIIRLSGEDSINIVNSMLDRSILDKASHTVTYAFVRDPHSLEILDEALITVFKAPKTFTREDVVEINCHGGQYVTRKILSLCVALGARMATPGEFTRRAFLNGRIDLTQAEAVQDIIVADSSMNATMAINGIKGSIAKLLNPLIQDLLDIIAHIEVNIDYPEYEDVEQLTMQQILPLSKNWLKKLDEIVQKAQSSRLIKAGVKTAILGKPNVGKSSLLNALLEEEKAIVSEVAGTTRDLVEGNLHLKNITLHLIDTAGIHPTQDVVEKIGIEKSMKVMKEAELILLILDASAPLDELDQELLDLTAKQNRLLVYNKKDCMETTNTNHIEISASNQQIESLIDAINNLYEKHIAIIDEPSLNNDRQIALAMQARNSMAQAIEALENEFELDLVTIDLQQAYTSCKEILGEVSRDDLLNTLFSNFCLGK